MTLRQPFGFLGVTVQVLGSGELSLSAALPPPVS
jgi:hypothetical protein